MSELVTMVGWCWGRGGVRGREGSRVGEGGKSGEGEVEWERGRKKRDGIGMG